MRPSKPYLATFRILVESPRIELGFSPCQAIFPLDHHPISKEVRSRIELDLRSYQERVLPEHLQTISDRGWNRTIGLLRVMQAS